METLRPAWQTNRRTDYTRHADYHATATRIIMVCQWLYKISGNLRLTASKTLSYFHSPDGSMSLIFYKYWWIRLPMYKGVFLAHKLKWTNLNPEQVDPITPRATASRPYFVLILAIAKLGRLVLIVSSQHCVGLFQTSCLYWSSWTVVQFIGSVYVL